MLRRQVISDRFTELGWSVAIAPAIATRMFATAVGDKEAVAYLNKWPDSHMLTGLYYSEGRNILESGPVIIEPTCGADDAIKRVDQFIAWAEKTISESYAVGLLTSSA